MMIIPLPKLILIGKINDNCHYIFLDQFESKISDYPNLNDSEINKIIFSIVEGLQFLHQHNISHGDISYDIIHDFQFSKDHSLCQDKDSEDIAKNKNPLFLFQCNDVHEGCSASLRGNLNSLLYIAYRMKYGALSWKKDKTKVVIQKYIFSSEILKLKKDENLEFLNVKMSSLKYHEKADFNCLMNRFKEEKKTNNECQTLCQMLLDMGFGEKTKY
uniref:Protein kinase domain-containing protein n=1 Tax=Strongyloides venezuelensis TaxID=75913 RepID=A0A0K0FJ84_STRVS